MRPGYRAWACRRAAHVHRGTSRRVADDPRVVHLMGTPSASYLPLIEQLASLDPPVFVFGGIAEDALLDGSMTRPHGDVDVLVARRTLDLHLEQLGSLGFSDFDVFFESPPGIPLVLGAANGGLSVELGVFDELASGIASFVLPSEN